jgi:hypothetical protein
MSYFSVKDPLCREEEENSFFWEAREKFSERRDKD